MKPVSENLLNHKCLEQIKASKETVVNREFKIDKTGKKSAKRI